VGGFGGLVAGFLLWNVRNIVKRMQKTGGKKEKEIQSQQEGTTNWTSNRPRKRFRTPKKAETESAENIKGEGKKGTRRRVADLSDATNCKEAKVQKQKGTLEKGQHLETGLPSWGKQAREGAVQGRFPENWEHLPREREVSWVARKGKEDKTVEKRRGGFPSSNCPGEKQTSHLTKNPTYKLTKKRTTWGG